MAAGVTIDFNANLTRFTSAIDKATSDLSRFQTQADRTAKNMTRIFGGLAAAIPTGLFVSFIKGTIDLADNLKDLGERTGVAVSTLAGLKSAAEKSGATIEEVALGMKHLALRIEEAKGGSARMAALLAELGVKGRDLEEDFFAIADAFKETADGQGKISLATEVFSRSGEKLIPLLNEGGKGLKEMRDKGSGFAEAMAKLAPDADKFNDQLTDLKDNATGAGAGFALRLVPSLHATAKEVNALMQGDHGFLALIRALGGISKLPFDAIFGNITIPTTAAARLKEMHTELKHMEDVKARGKTSILGAIFGTPEGLERQITVLKNQIVAFEKFGDKIFAKEPPPSRAGPSIVARNTCEADGNLWDGQKCVKRKKTTVTSSAKPKDPLGIESLLSSTSIERLKKIDAQIADLTKRFEGGRLAPETYREALQGLRTELEKIKSAKDAFGDGSFISIDPAALDMIRQQESIIQSLNKEMADDGARSAEEFGSALESLVSNTTLVKTKALHKNIEVLDQAFFEGIIGVQQYEEALKSLLEAAEKDTEKTKTIGQELGLVFESAFENAVTSGKSFRDVLGGIAQDIQKIVLRRTITEPLGNLVSSLIGQVDFGSLFKFADGGIMTSAGPLPLRKYARGGVATSPQLMLFGEGDQNEALVPLPDGRSIPVTLKGSTGGMSLVQNISIDARGSNGVDESRIRHAAEEGARKGYAMVVNDFVRGGPLAKLTGTAA